MKNLFILSFLLISLVFAVSPNVCKDKSEFDAMMLHFVVAQDVELTQVVHDNLWWCLENAPDAEVQKLKFEENVLFSKISEKYNAEVLKAYLDTYRNKKITISDKLKKGIEEIKEYKGSAPNLYNSNKVYTEHIDILKNAYLRSLESLELVAKHKPFKTAVDIEIVPSEEAIKAAIFGQQKYSEKIKNLYNPNWKMDRNNEDAVNLNRFLELGTKNFSYKELVKMLQTENTDIIWQKIEESD